MVFMASSVVDDAEAWRALPATRRMQAGLRQALKAGGLLLHFQPRMRLASGALAGCEALIRWPDRRHGMVPPSAFIPVAERSTLINEIGAWVLTEACVEAARWGGTRVSVNVSGRQVRSGQLLDQVAGALARSGLAPDRLELDLAESTLMGGGVETLLLLSAVRDLGVGLALDDFGSGTTSLALLRRLPLTAVKLDRSLIAGLPHDREDAAIVRSAIQAGQALGLSVVAEGIETEAQRAVLSGLGCDEGQGFLFHHPMPAEDMRLIALQHHVACGPPRSAPASWHDGHPHRRH